MESHAAVAALGSGDEHWVAAVLDDWHTAPLTDQQRAILGFLEKVTLHPEQVSADDAAPLRAAGLSDQAIEEALYVCFAFNVMDRLADAFDFPLPSVPALRRNGRRALIWGYRFISIPG